MKIKGTLVNDRMLGKMRKNCQCFTLKFSKQKNCGTKLKHIPKLTAKENYETAFALLSIEKHSNISLGVITSITP